jgi:ATP-dependent DNA helicase RecQ
VLLLDGAGCSTKKGHSILRFSKHFVNKIQELSVKGYEPKSAKVNFIVYWLNEETKQELLVVLPEVLFERSAKSERQTANGVF